MLGAWQRGSTGLCHPTASLRPLLGQWHLGQLCHQPGLSPAMAPSVYSHVHNDDHVLWGGGTLDVPAGYTVGSAGLTNYGGTAQEQSPARALGSCVGAWGSQGCVTPWQGAGTRRLW